MKSLCSPGPKAKSIHKKPLLSGTASLTMGSQEYSFCESPMSRSGWVGRVWIMAWYSPIQTGIWMTIGPRHPRGLTPRSRYSFIVS